MADTRVITAHVPVEMAEQVDKYAAELDRSRGWIVKQALMRWLSRQEEQNRLEAIEDGKGGIPGDDIGSSATSKPKPRKG